MSAKGNPISSAARAKMTATVRGKSYTASITDEEREALVRRNVLVLVRVHGETPEDAAALLKVPLETVTEILATSGVLSADRA